MLFDHNTISSLRNDALEAERSGRLTGKQLEIIRTNNWFKLFVPTKLGGLGLTMPEVLRIEEALAWIDGSVAWVVTLCAGAGWFVGFANQDLVRSLLNDPNFCIAGSGATGVADPNPNGFSVNGSWKYASGSLHATAFTVNCIIKGTNEVRSFFLLPNEVTIKHTWNSMGMVATGSNSFEAKDQQIGSERQFIIRPERAVLKDDIYQYPFLQLAETTLAVNISGMALRFIELSGNSVSLLDNHRKKFFNHPGSETSHALVKASRDIVNDLYWKCGLSAANKDTEINRVWRNFHTAAQHSLFSRKGR